MKTKTDETRVSHGSGGVDRGGGCAGEGLPDVFRRTVPVEESVFCPEAKLEGSVMDNHKFIKAFGPPAQDEFALAGQTEEEER